MVVCSAVQFTPLASMAARISASLASCSGVTSSRGISFSDADAAEINRASASKSASALRPGALRFDPVVASMMRISIF